MPVMHTKPDWASVRWIHVPIGMGLLNNTIQKHFLRGNRTASFSLAGPLLSCEALSLQNYQRLQDQLDVYNLLQPFTQLTTDLTASLSANEIGPELMGGIMSEAQKFQTEPDFWSLSVTDIPWQLGEGVKYSLLDTDVFSNPVSTVVEKQLLSRHPRYGNAVLVRDLFQCLHKEGFVLSMSPMTGINFLDVELPKDVQLPQGLRSEQSRPVLEHIRNAFSKAGTKMWPSKAAEWFAVRLLSKVLVVPHAHGANTIPTIQKAYLPLVRDLKNRRGSQFKRHESVKLVREYIACIDEISQIYNIYEQKVDLLAKLRKDCEALEGKASGTTTPNTMQPVAPTIEQYDMCKTMIEEVDWAVNQLKANHEGLPRTLSDTRSALEDLFQLSTIEQNELAIIAETNNKAILIFTVVTIVFLPLSFFTSYFGMNVQGVSSGEKTQGEFWAICAPVTIFVVVFTLIYGFQSRIYGTLWADRKAGRLRNRTSLLTEGKGRMF